MMQDFVRTATYHRAILQNHTDFKDKVSLIFLLSFKYLYLFSYKVGHKIRSARWLLELIGSRRSLALLQKVCNAVGQNLGWNGRVAATSVPWNSPWFMHERRQMKRMKRCLVHCWWMTKSEDAQAQAKATLRAFHMATRAPLLLCLQIAAQLPCFGLPGPSLEGAILGFTCRLTRKCAAHLMQLPQAAWVILWMSYPSTWGL